MALASSTTSSRRASKRDAAPENVNASKRPMRPNTAPSMAPTPSPALSPCRIRWCCRRRRPSSRRMTIPTKSPAANSVPAAISLMGVWTEVLYRRVVRPSIGRLLALRAHHRQAGNLHVPALVLLGLLLGLLFLRFVLPLLALLLLCLVLSLLFGDHGALHRHRMADMPGKRHRLALDLILLT